MGKHNQECACKHKKSTNKAECECENNCTCEQDCECDENCTCGENCNCDEQNKCNPDCTCGQAKVECKTEDCLCCDDKIDYLNQLQRVQAEFDNYRKRMVGALGDARQDGFMDAITQFLPALDSFKMATAMITDKNTLLGIQFIEKGILDTLAKMGVESIDATGKFNPDFHQAIDTEDSPEHETGDIVKECYKGFTYKGKVIRYSQVIVKK